jgi:hypothetical protein
LTNISSKSIALFCIKSFSYSIYVLKTTSFILESTSASYHFAVIKLFLALLIKKAICLDGNSFSSRLNLFFKIFFKTDSLSDSSYITKSFLSHIANSSDKYLDNTSFKINIPIE